MRSVSAATTGRRLRRLGAGLLALTLALALWPSTAPATPQVAPPPGYEAWLEPEELLVDVWFLGRFVGSARARHLLQQLSFDDPAEVVALLGPITDAARLQAALSRPLDSHEQLRCPSAAAAPCAELRPDPVALHFVPAEFRVTLLVDPALLPAPSDEPRFLPPSSAGASFLQALDGAAAGELGGDAGYNLRPGTTLAYGNLRLAADYAFSSGRVPFAETVEFAYDRAAWRYRGGLLRSSGDALLPSRRMLGIALGTHTDARADPEAASAGTLSVFLPAPAQVEVFRDGRLLDARSYDAGHQAIDASALPEGAYDVTLRIRDLQTGAVREEPGFIAKSNVLPPADQDLFLFEAGVARLHRAGLGDDDASPVALAAWRHRLADPLGVGLAARLLRKTAFAELDLQYLGRGLRAQGTLALDDRGTLGYAASLLAWGQHYSLALDARQFAGDGWVDDLAASEHLRADVQAQCCRGLRLGLRAREFSSVDGRRREFGPYAALPVFRRADLQLELQAEHLQRDDDRITLLQLLLHRGGPRWSVSSHAGYTGTSASTDLAASEELRGGLNSSWQAWRRAEEQMDVQALVSGAEARSRAAVGTRYRGTGGRFNAELDRNRTDARESSRYAVGLGLAAAGTTDGLYWGGSNYGSGALVLALDGDAAPGTRFRVLVDGRPRLELAAGERRVLYVPAYRSYAVRIEPLGGALHAFDESPRRVVLYPGNVQELRWPVSRVITVYGRARTMQAAPAASLPATPGTRLPRLDTAWSGGATAGATLPSTAPRSLALQASERIGAAQGGDVADAAIVNALDVAQTDGQGYFQAELRASEPLLRLRRPDGRECRIRIPPAPAGEDYLRLGSVSCAEVADARDAGTAQ